MRPVGTLLTGRNLWRGLLSLESRGFNVALVPLSRHGKTTLIQYEDAVAFKAGLTAHGVLAYGLSSPRLTLTGFHHAFTQRFRLIRRDLERCVELGLTGCIISISTGVETIGDIEQILRDTADLGITIIGRPNWQSIMAHSSIPGLAVYLDIAHEYYTSGDPRMWTPGGWQQWVDAIKGRLVLMAVTNMHEMGGYPTPMPLLAGDIALDVYRDLLTEFERVPVILDGTPFQVTRDLEVIRQLDARAVTSS